MIDCNCKTARTLFFQYDSPQGYLFQDLYLIWCQSEKYQYKKNLLSTSTWWQEASRKDHNSRWCGTTNVLKLLRSNWTGCKFADFSRVWEPRKGNTRLPLLCRWGGTLVIRSISCVICIWWWMMMIRIVSHDDDYDDLYIIGRFCLTRKMITLPNGLKSSSVAVEISFLTL